MKSLLADQPYLLNGLPSTLLSDYPGASQGFVTEHVPSWSPACVSPFLGLRARVFPPGLVWNGHGPPRKRVTSVPNRPLVSSVSASPGTLVAQRLTHESATELPPAAQPPRRAASRFSWPLLIDSAVGSCSFSCLVVSNSFATPWTVASQVPLSWDFPGKNTGVGCCFLLQELFTTQGLNLPLLHWQANSLSSRRP